MADPSSSSAGAARLSSFSAAADAAHLDDDSNDWKALQTTVVANQSVDLPELGSFNLYKLTPPLKERADLGNWIDQVEKVLQGYNLHHLINKSIPWPRIRDPNGKKWHTQSLWLSSSIHHTVMQEINARGSGLGLGLSTGWVMTIIDADLAKSLDLPLQKCTPVPVAGIGSRHLSSAFVSFDVFFRGSENVACIRVEAHLVDNLKAKLLIGMDLMGHEGFRLDLDAKKLRISSCMNIEIPIVFQA
jgi:hypothetical protein